MEPFIFIIVAGSLLFGLAVGSFIAARAVRAAHDLPQNLLGRSECLSCKRKLRAKDLIPLLSYTLLRGKCRDCKTDIPSYYFVTELCTGLGFAALMGLGIQAGIISSPLQNWPFLGQAALLLAIFSTLLYVSAVDLMVMAFPVKALGLMAGICLLISGFTGYPVALLDGIYGGLFFAGIFALIRMAGQLFRRKEVMGEGDVWMALLIGVSLGFQRSIVAFYAAFILGAIFAIIILLRARIAKSASPKAVLPFAPFLLVGWFIATLYGSYLFTLLFPF